MDPKWQYLVHRATWLSLFPCDMLLHHAGKPIVRLKVAPRSLGEVCLGGCLDFTHVSVLRQSFE